MQTAVVPVLPAAQLQLGTQLQSSASQVQAKASISCNPISLSPSLDRQISEELAEYLSGQEQTIDNCRDLLGTCWDNMLANTVEDDESIERQPLMLEAGDPMLTMDEATTPDLLTPSASPSHNSV